MAELVPQTLEMTKVIKKGLLLSDFNISNFGAFLQNSAGEPQVQTVVAPFGQVVSTLFDGESELWKGSKDFAVIWTRAEAVIGGFSDVLGCSQVNERELMNGVDDFCSAVFEASQRVKSVFVPIWTIPPHHHGSGILDLRPEGASRILMRMNSRLIEAFDDVPNVFPLNTWKWLQLSGQKSYNPRLWYMGKIAYGNEVFKTAAADVKAALRGLAGKARKVVVLDLDDTLWGGVVGDVGWQHIRLGGHDQTGEAFVDFQQELKALTRRGILLGIVSKNEESNAFAAIDNHPEMLLRRQDFAGWKINWLDKAANLVELVRELNVGLESVVFIDDNPVERGRVREALPQVFVPDWPTDPRFFPQALLGLDCFEAPLITDEDRERPKMYVSERQRAELRAQVPSMDEWLQKLEVSVSAEPLDGTNLSRATQLLNKTNQINLSTRRMSEIELQAWAANPERRCWVLRVRDRFGNSGLAGFLSVEKKDSCVRIVDFVLSCRVMGRKVEECMLRIATDWARSACAVEVLAIFEPTEKNKPCLDFFIGSGFQASAPHRFIWRLSENYPECAHVRLSIIPHAPVAAEATKAVCSV